jgi:hypothetical protein
MSPFLNKILLTVVDKWDSAVKAAMEPGHTKPPLTPLTSELRPNLSIPILQKTEHADKTSMLNILCKAIHKSFMEILMDSPRLSINNRFQSALMHQAWVDIQEESGIAAALNLEILITPFCLLAMKVTLGLFKTVGDLVGERMDISELPEMETKTPVESLIWAWFQPSEFEKFQILLDE